MPYKIICIEAIEPADNELFAGWSAVLPKVRPLKLTDRVCILHFHEDDVITSFDHVINGEIVSLPRDRPKLKSGAIPRLELPTEDELILNKQMKPLHSNTDKVCNANIIEDSLQFSETDFLYTCGHFPAEEELVDYIVTPTIAASEIKEFEYINHGEFEELPVTDLFNLIYNNLNEVTTPNTQWGLHRCPNRSMLCFSYFDFDSMTHSKKLIIRAANGTVELFDGTENKTLNLCNHIQSIVDVSTVLCKLDKYRLCCSGLSIDCEIFVDFIAKERTSEDVLCTSCLNNMSVDQLFSII